MNQNRNNNRRRGRGGNRGQGGGNQGNRIDSRARGNAPQLLEKYKKLAHDASLNGDRVQTEYYLQFADHYFRVVADSRAQREEQRPQRDDRERDNAADDDEFDNEAESGAGRQYQQSRRRERGDDGEARAGEGAPGVEGEEADAGDNPFVRDTRARRPRTRSRNPANGEAKSSASRDDEPGEDSEAAFDAAVLPPSIAREEEPPRTPRTRARRPRPADNGDQEALEEAS